MQWQVSTDTGLTWSNITGQTATTVTLTPTALSLNAHQYRAVCTNLAGAAPSSAATLTVTAPPTGPTGPTSTVLTPPVLGVDLQAQPQGTVLARLTPGGPLVPLIGPVDLSVGSLVDARAGTLTLTMAMPGNHTQTAAVGRGRFVVTQPRSQHGLTQLTLAGGSFASCPRPGAAKAQVARTARKTTKPTHVVRQLWSKDHHGKFQTHGHNSVATVRGTEWVTQDRCDGTPTSSKASSPSAPAELTTASPSLLDTATSPRHSRSSQPQARRARGLVLPPRPSTAVVTTLRPRSP